MSITNLTEEEKLAKGYAFEMSLKGISNFALANKDTGEVLTFPKLSFWKKGLRYIVVGKTNGKRLFYSTRLYQIINTMPKGTHQ